MEQAEKEVCLQPQRNRSSPFSSRSAEAVEERRPPTSNPDIDEALRFLIDQVGFRDPSSDEEQELLKKIDWAIMPLMLSCFTLQYLDRILINYAAVMGLYDDAHINTNQFSNLALFFYVSYLALELPHGYGMQRLPTAKYLGCVVTLWGSVVAATSACRSYGALIVTRVLLGCFESAVAPALILMTAMWYKRKEQPPRVGIWYLGGGLGTIVGSLISFGFQHYGEKSFTSWQIMFLVLGLVTTSFGIVLSVLLPDSPVSSRLSSVQKVWAIRRLEDNQTGIENKRFKSDQILECLLDPQTYLFSLITLSASVPNGAIASYQATLIENFGFDPKAAALLQIPSGTIAIISVLIATFLAGRFDQRGINVITLLVVGALGGALMAFLPGSAKIGKLIGNYLTNCIGAALPLIYSWVAANFAGHTKKVTMNAILLMSFCGGNIIGPLTFREKDTPDFIPAKITIMITCAFAGAMTVVLREYYAWENRKREHAVIGDESSQPGGTNLGFLDLTDKMNRKFRYRL